MKIYQIHTHTTMLLFVKTNWQSQKVNAILRQRSGFLHVCIFFPSAEQVTKYDSNASHSASSSISRTTYSNTQSSTKSCGSNLLWQAAKGPSLSSSIPQDSFLLAFSSNVAFSFKVVPSSSTSLWVQSRNKICNGLQMCSFEVFVLVMK